MQPQSNWELSTKRIALLIPDRTAAAAVAAYFLRNRSWLQRSSPTLPAEIGTEAYWQARLERQQQLALEGRELRYFLRLHGQSEIVGTANLTEIARGPLQQCQLGFGLDEHRTGKGLMTEALREVLEHAFRRLRLMKVRANYLPSNVASAQLLARLGFSIEGRADRHVCIAGRWEEHVLSACLNPDPSCVEVV